MEKKRGDEYLKKLEFDMALKHYSKVIMAIKILQDDSSLEKANLNLDKYVKEYGVNFLLIKKNQIPANLNMAYIYNKLKDWKSVISSCSKVIEYDKNNVKALYRRSMAYVNLLKYENADKDIETLEDLIPRTKELEDLIKYMENHQLKNRENNDLLYKKMYKKFVESKIKILKNNKIFLKGKFLNNNNIAKITNDQKEIKRRCIDIICNIPKTLKIISFVVLNKIILDPYNFVFTKLKNQFDYLISFCKKNTKKDQIRKNIMKK